MCPTPPPPIPSPPHLHQLTTYLELHELLCIIIAQSYPNYRKIEVLGEMDLDVFLTEGGGRERGLLT